MPDRRCLAVDATPTPSLVQYLLRIPVTADWDKIDREMLTSFFASDDGCAVVVVAPSHCLLIVVIAQQKVQVARSTGARSV